jgi:hypothetical protein
LLLLLLLRPRPLRFCCPCLIGSVLDGYENDFDEVVFAELSPALFASEKANWFNDHSYKSPGSCGSRALSLFAELQAQMLRSVFYSALGRQQQIPFWRSVS